MEDIFKSSFLMLAGEVMSFLPLLFIFSVLWQFGPGHIGRSYFQRSRTGVVEVRWQRWGIYSLVLLLASFGGTVVLLHEAGYNFSDISILIQMDLSAGFAASVIMIANIILKSPRCYPNRAYQTGILIFLLLSLTAAVWGGIASGQAHDVIVESSLGAIFGLAIFYPLVIMQRAKVPPGDKLPSPLPPPETK